MKQVRDFFDASLTFLQGKGIPNPKRSVEELIGATLGIKRMDVYLQFDRPMDVKEIDVLRSYISRRAKGEPVEYILGAVSFFGLELKVNGDVLIPRPETELLIPLIQKWCASPKKILDICTGSGCLALALKKAFPEAEVVAVDLSEDALAVARENGALTGLDVEFLLGDLIEPVQGRSFDLIVSNPPYISKNEYDHLDRTVRDHEPEMALVAGEDGLSCYRKLAEGLESVCSENAKIVFEIGFSQKEALFQLFDDPKWKSQRCEQDWSGKDRFFFLEYQGETL